MSVMALVMSEDVVGAGAGAGADGSVEELSFPAAAVDLLAPLATPPPTPLQAPLQGGNSQETVVVGAHGAHGAVLHAGEAGLSQGTVEVEEEVEEEVEL